MSDAKVMEFLDFLEEVLDKEFGAKHQDEECSGCAVLDDIQSWFLEQGFTITKKNELEAELLQYIRDNYIRDNPKG